MLAWRIRPDPDGLHAWPARSMQLTADNGEMSAVIHPATVVHPGLGRWRGLAIPPVAAPGERIRYAAHFTLDPRIRHKTFHETVVFLHLRDQDGRRVMALDYPLRKAALTPQCVPWQQATLPGNLPPGRYHVDAGLYNVRTRRRHALHGDDGVGMDRGRRRFRAAVIDIGVDKSAAHVHLPSP